MSYRAPSPTTSPTGPGKRLGRAWSVFRGQSQPATLNSSHSFRSGEKITVTPSSKELLFYPPSMEATVSGGMRPPHERVLCLCFSICVCLNGCCAIFVQPCLQATQKPLWCH
jgi:hypothetical protein